MLSDIAHGDFFQRLKDGQVAVELVRLVLGVVPNVHVVPNGQLTRGAGLLFQEQPCKGGFSRTIFPHQGHFFLPGHDEIQVVKDGQVPKLLFERLGLEDDLSGSWRWRKAKSDLGVFSGIDFQPLQLV